MLLSSLRDLIDLAIEEHGDIEAICVTAPFGTGETEVITEEHIDISKREPNNGDAATEVTFTIGDC